MAWILILLAGVIFCIALMAAVRLSVKRVQEQRMQAACDLFHRRREWLEAEFLTFARRSGKPRGLEWSNVEFEKEVEFARDRHSGQLQAFVAVTVSFEAITGGGMEHVEAVSNLRSATAVFRYRHPKWETDGRAVFNLNPRETIQHFKHELEPVAAPRTLVKR